MEMLSHPHHHTSHPTHKSWDRVPPTENNDLLNEEIKKLIQGLPTPIDTKLYSNKDQHAYPATKEDINTYTPEYQQFAHKAEKNILNKKREYSVNKDLLESKAIGISEIDHSDLHKDIRSLEKLHANIILGKREYIAKGEEKFEHFDYPGNNSFKNAKAEEKALAKQKQDEYLAVNTNIQLSLQQGLGRMETSLTTTEEFKFIKNLVDQGNLNEDREELSNFIDSLNAYLQDHSSNTASQKEQIRGYLEENRWVVAKQISKANQRFKEAEDHIKITEEELQNHRKIAKNYEKPVICDTYAQATKRAKQTRERAKNAEGQSKEADERAKQAAKRVEQAKKLGIKAAIKAAEQSLHCAKEVASLARKLAEGEHTLAKDIDEWANKLKSNPLSHNPEEEIKILEKEKKAIEDGKNAINSIKSKQAEETDVLKEEIEILKIQKIDNITHQNQDVNTKILSESQSKRIDKARDILSAIESKSENNDFIIDTAKNRIKEEIDSIIADAVKIPEKVAIENSIFSREKEKEILDHGKSVTTQIDKDVETIGKASKIFAKQDEIYRQIAIYHQSLASSHSTIDQTDNSSEKYAVQSEQAQIRSEQHEIRKKQAEDRYKQYHKRELQLTDQHIDARTVQQAALHAKEIRQHEHSLQNAENSLATYAKQATESIKQVDSIEKEIKTITAKKDQSDHDKLSDSKKSLAEAEKNLSDANANIAKWTKDRDELLSKTQIAHKLESTAIAQYNNIAKETFNAAKEDLETLVNLHKHLDIQEVSANFSNDIIGKSCKSLERNLRYMKYKSNSDLNNALEIINIIDINSINKHAKDIISGSEAQIPICNCLDGEKWLFTTNGLCMNMKELRNIKIDPETKQTQIRWREDATKLSIFGSKKFSKRISSFHLDINNKTLTFEAPGTHYKRGLGENERSLWKVTNNGKEEVYNAEELEGIEVTLHKHEKDKDEISIQTTIKTLPKNTVNHDDLYNGCYSRLHLQSMNRINTESGEFIGQNNKFRKPIFHFDFTETANVPGVGLLLHEESTNRSIHPDSIVKVDRMLNDANKVEEENKAKIMKYEKYSKKLLKNAIESQSRDKIQHVIKILEQNDALAASETAVMNYRLQNAPKDIYEVIELKATSKTYLKRLADRQHENTKEFFQSRNAFNHRLKLLIKNLHNNQASKISKEQAIEGIYATYRLKNHDFQLLIDPNRDGEVKCSNPDSLMLIEEWETYANKDLSEQEKAYQQRIENFIMENCHSYWKNHISIIKAANYAAKGDNGLNDAIKSLQEGLSLESGSLDSSYTGALGRLGKTTFGLLNGPRSSDEQELVHYLDKAFSQARTEGVDQLLYRYLSIAKHIQQSKLQTLRIAKYALSPSISSKDALQSIEAMPKDELSASTSQEMEKPTKLQQIKDEIDTLVNRIPYRISEGKSPQEFAMHVSSNLYDYSLLRHKYIIESTDNTHLKQSLEQHAEEHIKFLHQHTMEIYKLEFKKREAEGLEDLKQKNRKRMARYQFHRSLLYAIIAPLQQGMLSMNTASRTVGSSIWRAISSVG